ncbi:High-affinity branched-chain amino acid transport system permease protein LivH [Dehalococcoides mccartyi]|uniref:High-affinity branched-chain amino acid transport system permease protein LivH n=1 Tax=Dehalococcoides mccartyi TaxID=61435 RepID=A0A328ER50_9CHLR|nr:High-affinity branched-chain amino acid transport system permease protein LivH [Dehalococcoides mccartyi]
MAAVAGINVQYRRYHSGLVETGIKAFSVVILGGLDSFLGAMIAGPIIGLAENLGGGYLTALTWPGVKEVIPFIIIIIVMFIKPYGLFGQERIERI